MSTTPPVPPTAQPMAAGGAVGALQLLSRAAALCEQAPLLSRKVSGQIAAVLGTGGSPHAAFRALHASLGCSVRQQYRGVLLGKLLALQRRPEAAPSGTAKRLNAILGRLTQPLVMGAGNGTTAELEVRSFVRLTSFHGAPGGTDLQDVAAHHVGEQCLKSAHVAGHVLAARLRV